MKKYIASFLAICMIFVMVPILPAEAAGLEDTFFILLEVNLKRIL